MACTVECSILPIGVSSNRFRQIQSSDVIVGLGYYSLYGLFFQKYVVFFVNAIKCE